MSNKILVLGAGGLIGRFLVKSLLAAEYQVLACDLHVNTMQDAFTKIGLELAHPHLTLLSIDISNRTALNNLFETYEDIDGAVNCTYPRNKNYGADFLKVTLHDFNENLALNLGSSFLFIQCCVEYFNKQQRAFSLVNISSIYGVVPPKFEIYQDAGFTMPVEYAAIKSSLIHLSKYATKYVNDSRFRVNVVSPGGILDLQPETFLQNYKAKCLGTGMLKPEQITETIIFLLSSKSEFINGQNIIIDDGFTL